MNAALECAGSDCLRSRSAARASCRSSSGAVLSCRRRHRSTCRRATGSANDRPCSPLPWIRRSSFDLVELVVAVGVADAIQAVRPAALIDHT